LKKVHSKSTEKRQGQTVGVAVIGSGYCILRDAYWYIDIGKI